MARNLRFDIGICDNDMQYQELHKKHSIVDRDIIMQKLRKDAAVKATWTNAILKGRKQIIQESLHTFVPASLFG